MTPSDIVHVDGADAGRVFLYALSTCVWCKRTKRLLDSLGIGYDYVDVDTLTGDTKNEVTTSLRQWNPAASYPTIVINDKDCVIGFDEDKIREAIGK